MEDKKGRYGLYGGQYIPETLVPAVQEVEEAYEKYKNDPEFQKELKDLMEKYAGRPSLLYYAEKMTKDAKIVHTYDSCHAAEMAISGLNKGVVSKVCRGIRKSAFGYVWKYAA